MAEKLLIPNNCEFVSVSKLNEAVTQNQKIWEGYQTKNL